jgi:hypothetical protein
MNPMLDRFNVSLFVGLGKYLQELADRAPIDSRITLLEPIIGLQVYLDLFYSNKYISRSPLPLKTSKSAGMSLHSTLGKVRQKISDNGEDANNPLEADDITAVKEAMDRFETVLTADLARAFTYVVSQVGILAVDSLIDSADDVYEGYKDRIPSAAILDTKEAGKSIAFNLPTAAGFHIARATEGVLLKYLATFGQTPKKSERNWGKYTELLRDNTDASPKVLNTIDQIRILHRNPLLHPEASLTMPEALSLWAICCSAIQAMVADMERKQVEPKPEILGMLPPDESTIMEVPASAKKAN